MKINQWTLAMALAGITFCGVTLVQAEPTGERPVRKNLQAGPKGEAREKAQAREKIEAREKGERPGPLADRPGPVAERRGEIMDAVRGSLRDLELSEDQKAQIKTILETARDSREKYMDEHREEAQALREKMKAAREAGDKQQMKQLAEELRAIIEAGPKPQDTVNKIKNVLNAEQREKLEARIAQWKENHPRPERPRLEGKSGDEERKQRKPKAQD